MANGYASRETPGGSPVGRISSDGSMCVWVLLQPISGADARPPHPESTRDGRYHRQPRGFCWPGRRPWLTIASYVFFATGPPKAA